MAVLSFSPFQGGRHGVPDFVQVVTRPPDLETMWWWWSMTGRGTLSEHLRETVGIRVTQRWVWESCECLQRRGCSAWTLLWVGESVPGNLLSRPGSKCSSTGHMADERCLDGSSKCSSSICVIRMIQRSHDYLGRSTKHMLRWTPLGFVSSAASLSLLQHDLH